MSMIKRGNSDNNRPTVIQISYRCATCGHFEQGATARSTCPTCPTCQTAMIRVPASPMPISPPECPGGICNLNDTDTI
jgi:hypothetical protein